MRENQTFLSYHTEAENNSGTNGADVFAGLNRLGDQTVPAADDKSTIQLPNTPVLILVQEFVSQYRTATD
ncbi:hypothetical protein [Nocardia beijingensis]